MLEVIHTFYCGSHPVSSAAFSPDGKLFASASDNGTIRIWQTTGKLQQTLNGHHKPVNHITFSPNSKLLMSASDDDRTLWVWNVDNGIRQEERKSHSGPVAFSPDGMSRASCSAGGWVELWGSMNKTLKGNIPLAVKLRSKRPQMLDGYAEIKALVFSPTGSLLACGYDNGKFKLWNMLSEYANDRPGHKDSIIALAFSQDEKWIASASHDGTIGLWDMGQADNTFQLKGSSVGVYHLAFSPDSKLLASVSFDEKIRLWDMAKRELCSEFEAAGTIHALSFSLNSIRVGVEDSYSINICEITI